MTIGGKTAVGPKFLLIQTGILYLLFTSLMKDELKHIFNMFV